MINSSFLVRAQRLCNGNNEIGLSIVWKWKLLSCVQLCMDYTIHGIFQARILEWVAFPFSRGSPQPRDQTQASHITGGFFTSWATREAQESWSGYPFPFPADLPYPGIELGSPALQADSLPAKLPEMPPLGQSRCKFSWTTPRKKIMTTWTFSFTLPRVFFLDQRFDPFPALIIDFVGICKLWPRQNPAAFLFL